jgi:NAD(P)-dependent dehydrogenase (short-subunit alcohol dehydrogenase family)
MSWSVEGRTVLVTGGNSGIGRATAVELARRGGEVIITARDPERGRHAVDEIAQRSGRRAALEPLDLASFASVRALAQRLSAERGRVDVLVNNAGVYRGTRRTTEDGHEWTLGVNHLGPFLLTCLLAADPGTRPHRVISLASAMHTHAKCDVAFRALDCPGRYRGLATYARSKLANVLFTVELSRRFAAGELAAFAVHPGLVATRIAQDGDSCLGSMAWKLGRRWMRSPAEGASGPVYLATEPGVEHESGGYFADQERVEPGAAATSIEAAGNLWRLSAAVVGCDAETRDG